MQVDWRKSSSGGNRPGGGGGAGGNGYSDALILLKVADGGAGVQTAITGTSTAYAGYAVFKRI